MTFHTPIRPATPSPLRITEELRRIANRDGIIHRLTYAIASPIEADRCAKRTTQMLSDLSLKHPHDPKALSALSAALSKLERRPRYLFNGNKNAATNHLAYTCMLLLKQATLQNLQDTPAGRLIETHLTRALIAQARTNRKRTGRVIDVLDKLINPDAAPGTKPDFTRPEQYMICDIEALKPATNRIIMAVLHALTDADDRLRARLYLQHDANLTIRINLPELIPEIESWLDASAKNRKPAHAALKNWVRL